MSDRSTITTELKELSSHLPGQPPRMPYAVPTGYFEGLAEQVLTRIRREEARQELHELSPLLSGLSREVPYSTPYGYFDRSVALPANRQAPVLSLFQRTWVRYAVAAAVLAAGIFLWVGQPAQTPVTAGKVILEVKEDIQQLSEKEQGLLQEFVAAGMNGQETAQVDNTPLSASALLAGVTEAEMNEFLEQSEFITTETND